MYISSQLFGADHDLDNNHISLVAMAQEHIHTAQLGKRKRGSDEFGPTATIIKQRLANEQSFISNPAAVKTILRTSSPSHTTLDRSSFSHSITSQVSQPPLKQRRHIKPVRSSHYQQQQQQVSLPPSPPSSEKQHPDNQECHICHTHPRLKSELDRYADCQRCEERVCYICIRKCVGNGCGERKICKTCSVEQGMEGETWCLDCYQRDSIEHLGKLGEGGDRDDWMVVEGG